MATRSSRNRISLSSHSSAEEQSVRSLPSVLESLVIVKKPLNSKFGNNVNHKSRKPSASAPNVSVSLDIVESQPPPATDMLRLRVKTGTKSNRMSETEGEQDDDLTSPTSGVGVGVRISATFSELEEAIKRDNMHTSFQEAENGGNTSSPSYAKLVSMSSANSRSNMNLGRSFGARGDGFDIESEFKLAYLTAEKRIDFKQLKKDLLLYLAVNLRKPGRKDTNSLKAQEFYKILNKEAAGYMNLISMTDNGFTAINTKLQEEYGMTLQCFNRVRQLLEDVKNIIETKLGNSPGTEHLYKALAELIALRTALVRLHLKEHHSPADESFGSDLAAEVFGLSADPVEQIKEIVNWTLHAGLESLVAKLRYFYFNESKGVNNIEDEVPFHTMDRHYELREFVLAAQDLHDNAVTNASKTPKKRTGTASTVDEEEELFDTNEVLFLWYALFNFFSASNLFYSEKCEDNVEIFELIRQVENSVYYILEHGLEEFNKKIKQRYYGILAKTKYPPIAAFTLDFKLPKNRKDDIQLIRAFVTSQYENAGKRTAADGPVRTFEKLLKALSSKLAKDNSDSSSPTAGKRLQRLKDMSKPKETVSRPEDSNPRATWQEIAQADMVMKKKLRLFLLQSMRVSAEDAAAEAEWLFEFYISHGLSALETRLRISYGTGFHDIFTLTLDEVEKHLANIATNQRSRSRVLRLSMKNPKRNMSFSNVYHDLAFNRRATRFGGDP